MGVCVRCTRERISTVRTREIRSWLLDMDGVLVHEAHAIPGADRFLARLRELDRPFLVLTNNSIYTPRDLAARLSSSGLGVPEDAIWTSALATAHFLQDQRPGGSAGFARTDMANTDPTRNWRNVMVEERTRRFEAR